MKRRRRKAAPGLYELPVVKPTPEALAQALAPEEDALSGLARFLNVSPTALAREFDTIIAARSDPYRKNTKH
jgi:hypothetical protein